MGELDRDPSRRHHPGQLLSNLLASVGARENREHHKEGSVHLGQLRDNSACAQPGSPLRSAINGFRRVLVAGLWRRSPLPDRHEEAAFCGEGPHPRELRQK